MNIVLYNNKSDSRVLNKSIEQIATIDVILKSAQNIMSPEIMLQTKTLPIEANYCYISDFGRYYYINAQRLDNGNVSKIELTVDVLMSFKDMILKSTVVAERTTNKYNRYLPDIVPTLAKFNNIYKLFTPPVIGNPFYSDGTTANTNSMLLTVLKG